MLLGDEDGVGRRRRDVFKGVCESEFVVDGFVVVVKSLRLRFWDVEQGVVKGQWGSLEEGLGDIRIERYRISHELCEDARKVDDKLVILREIPAEEERMLMLLSNSPGVKALRWSSKAKVTLENLVGLKRLVLTPHGLALDEKASRTSKEGNRREG